MLYIVTATRCHSADEFNSSTLAGNSFKRLQAIGPVNIGVVFNSGAGLPAAYNAGIDAASPHDTLVFMHDDVQIDDWLLETRLDEALRRFDVVGIAGNAEREPGQATWYGLVTDLTEDRYLLDARGTPRGAVAYPDGAADFFSREPHPAKLLDGCFLAVRKASLDAHGIRFDTRFFYHFYDLDFCRQCEEAGLSMGVWPLALTHGSRGRFDANWAHARNLYFEKWRE